MEGAELLFRDKTKADAVDGSQVFYLSNMAVLKTTSAWERSLG